MRGDGVGVGDVGAVHGGGWVAGHIAVGDDGGGTERRKRDAGFFGGCWSFERVASGQRSWNRVGVGDFARTWV